MGFAAAQGRYSVVAYLSSSSRVSGEAFSVLNKGRFAEPQLFPLSRTSWLPRNAMRDEKTLETAKAAIVRILIDVVGRSLPLLGVLFFVQCQMICRALQKASATVSEFRSVACLRW